MERPYSIDHLNHIVLRVRDLQKSVPFYGMIGATLQGEVAAGTLMRIPSGQSIILQERSDYLPSAVGSVDHVNLMIRAESIWRVADYLRENGAEIVGEPEEGRAGPTVNVRDPDGYVLEIRIVREQAGR
jgi:catechol 2,3-dioxygenase-like lactoylglutathione lyase family enzyme